MFSANNQTIAVLQWGVVIGASLAAAIFDLRTRRIPNALIVPLLIAGLVQAVWVGSLSGFADAVAACFLLALPFVFLFIFAGGGAGDAKLMGAIGTWMGLKQGITVLACVCLAGGILAIATAVAKRRLKVVMVNILLSIYNFVVAILGKRGISSAAELARPAQTDKLIIPYGVAIFAGVCAAAGFTLLW